jgi:hypothetical protein
MTYPSTTTAQTFDVRSAGRSFESIQRKTLYLYLGLDAMLAVSLLLLGLAIYSAALARGVGSTNVAVLGAVFGVVATLFAFVVLSTPRFSAGATEVTLGEEGVVIRYPRSGAASFQWTNPHSRTPLYDYSAHPQMVRDDRAYSLIVPWGRLSMLTEESFQSTLTTAHERGAQVICFKRSAARYGFSPVSYRLEGAEPARHGRLPRARDPGTSPHE